MWRSTLTRTMAAAPLAALSLWALLAAAPAWACSPPLEGWLLGEVWPSDGMEAVPVNGVISVDLTWTQGEWPADEVIREQVQLELTRDGDEVVEGDYVIDRELGRVRFVSMFPLAEGIAYHLRVSLDNSEQGTGVEVFDLGFTTGDVLEDEFAPAFSGLQGLALTEYERTVYECCVSRDELCDTCGSCSWCWQVDWAYPPQTRLEWREAARPQGASPLRFAVYRYDSQDAERGELVHVAQGVGDTGVSLRLVQADGDQGPWCYLVEAVNVYGQRDGNQSVRCVTLDQLTPVERREVPTPDLSGCRDEEVEPDMGLPDVVDADADMEPGADLGGPDAEDATPDAPQGEDGELTVDISPGGGDDGCSCQSPARPLGGAPWGALALALLGGVALSRRRQARR